MALSMFLQKLNNKCQSVSLYQSLIQYVLSGSSVYTYNLEDCILKFKYPEYSKFIAVDFKSFSTSYVICLVKYIVLVNVIECAFTPNLIGSV